MDAVHHSESNGTPPAGFWPAVKELEGNGDVATYWCVFSYVANLPEKDSKSTDEIINFDLEQTVY